MKYHMCNYDQYIKTGLELEEPDVKVSLGARSDCAHEEPHC